jgi:hypothetical protein
MSTNMNYTAATAAMQEHKAVKREAWPDGHCAIIGTATRNGAPFEKTCLRKSTNGGHFAEYSPSNEDIAATDWQIVK